ncbi:RNA polymerase sigma factor [Panacibacter ginsenosidivorans]|uniref:RNA polymerase sigma factor n=2 Tax=Panacibacter ginsenosidivorans TaxID=1813871 RepID=A0A5B8V900_9BACT|nr:RNA polymerase sigma factor [Panacibacter ginsenosidivorans]
MADKPKQNVVQAVRDYGRKLFGFIRGRVNTDEDAEDILQDVWYQFSNTSATETIEQVSGWLFAVARNKITDRYRKKQPQLIDDLSYEDEDGELHFTDILLTDTNNPETEHIRNIFWEELFVALDELPENQRNVFVQNELEDKTLQEIANESGENLKTIISRKRYAVQHLRKRLQHLYNDLINY